jgi:hypothetical protein
MAWYGPRMLRLLLIGGLLFTSGPTNAQERPAPAVDHHQHLFSPATRVLSPTVKPVSADDLIAFLDEAIANGDPRTKHLYFDVSGLAGLGDWTSRGP